MSSLTVEHVELIQNSNSKMRGSEARYFSLGNGWGAKVIFAGEEARDEIYNNQRLCYCGGFAPKLGDKFSIYLDQQEMFGYITEEAKDTAFSHTAKEMGVWDQISEQHVAEMDFSIYMKVRKHSYAINDNALKALYAKVDKAHETGEITKAIYKNIHRDNHCHNWGYNNDGEPIIIDFGFACFI